MGHGPLTSNAQGSDPVDFARVLWIGGSPCSGKSSIAGVLARQYGLRVYSCDDEYERHLKRAVAGRHPRMVAAASATWDDVWMHPVGYLVERELAFYREEFEMIREDLLGLPDTRVVCAEGAALLPECVAPLLADTGRAIWVVPTERFQRETYARREWVADILSQCTRPEEAWENWMGRDAGFARAVALQARERGLRVLEVDGGQSIEEHAEDIAQHFGLRD